MHPAALPDAISIFVAGGCGWLLQGFSGGFVGRLIPAPASPHTRPPASHVPATAHAPLFFLIAPAAESEASLVQRLVERKTESADKLALRVATARSEVARLDEFDYGGWRLLLCCSPAHLFT